MTEYIKREDAIAAIENCIMRSDMVEAWNRGMDEAVYLIKRVPSADVVEQKTGKWERVVEQPYFRKHYHEVACSICHNKGREKWCYCPNCGARMVEDGNTARFD